MDNKYIIKRITAIFLVLSIVICVFSSCNGSKTAEEEITRGTEQIEKPSETTTSAQTATTAAAGETTTSALSSLAQYTTSASTENVTLADDQAEQAVEEAASSGGLSAVALASFVTAMGFDYDASQGIFYTNLDNWQRSANYVGHYDTLAKYGNMHYRTVKMDFGPYDNLNWRIQMWKGQYGVFGGSEVGVYTNDPNSNAMLYNCADNDHLLYMSTTMYLTKADYEAGNVYFSRAWQAHWWLTGFKFGVVDPATLILSVRIRVKSLQMADMFENSLVAAGFKEGDAKETYDTYHRSLNDFYILWDSVGSLNDITSASANSN